MRGKQGRLGFSFKIRCPWEMKQIDIFCFGHTIIFEFIRSFIDLVTT
uniref:Uncharacterized protein n=1 Tax=Vitis vinifera TaxID=29760 RepID=F6HAG5_VITVI